MKYVLVLGAKGQLGAELVGTLSAKGFDVLAADRSNIDLRDVEQIEGFIDESKCEAIINCAAYTAVDKAEQEPELAYLINRDVPGRLAKVAKSRELRFIHISTDFVFDGLNSQPYIESDLPNPLSVYGKSKLAGEELVSERNPDALILRTSWVYGNLGSNFVKTMLRLAAENKTLRVVNDQQGSPTWTRDISDALAQLVVSCNRGIFHFSNSGVTTWYELAVTAIEIARERGEKFLVEEVLPITTAEYPTAAIRPKYSALSSKKLEAEIGVSLVDWKSSLKNMLSRE